MSIAVAAAVILGAGACARNAQRGAVIGGAGGAVVGGVIGAASGSTAKGAIIGAAVGGAAGAIIGDQMDRRAAELRQDIPGAKVERVGEGILVTFDTGLLFGYDSVTDSFSFAEVFGWDPITDKHEFTGYMNSYLLENKVAVKRGIPATQRRVIYQDLERRARVLQKLHQQGITDFDELYKVIIKAKQQKLF
jgi:uncharacterized protein YcfJ